MLSKLLTQSTHGIFQSYGSSTADFDSRSFACIPTKDTGWEITLCVLPSGLPHIALHKTGQILKRSSLKTQLPRNCGRMVPVKKKSAMSVNRELLAGTCTKYVHYMDFALCWFAMTSNIDRQTPDNSPTPAPSPRIGSPASKCSAPRNSPKLAEAREIVGCKTLQIPTLRHGFVILGMYHAPAFDVGSRPA